MQKWITILLICVSSFGIAQNNALFNKANTAYNEGKYQDAITDYEKILENGKHAVEIYFNLGNAYYKLNQAAPSIYYYEKALLLQPEDKEIRENLAFAKNMTLDSFKQLPENELSSFYQKTVAAFSFDQWAWIAVIFVIILVLAYLGYYFTKYTRQKRISFIISAFAAVLAVVSIIMAYLNLNDFNKENPAIIFADETIVKAEPNNQGSETFRLHQGAKVNVLEAFEDWQKIMIPNGNTGWVPAKDLRVLKDF